MKTPEEIKKGLECCRKATDTLECPQECPYYKDDCDCSALPYQDCLAYTQQLEADNAQQARCVEILTDKLNAINDALPRWISVKERLPEEGELVVFIPTINQGSIYVGKLSHTGARGGVLFENRQGRTTMKYYAKYWMPLPEPPKEG